MPSDDRHPNGRFKEGVCPNPMGRPRRPKPNVRQQLLSILQEEVPAGSKKITMLEVLFRSLVREAAKDPRLLVRFLPQLLMDEADAEPSSMSTADEDQATIDAFRQGEHERSHRQHIAPPSDDDDGEN